MPVFRIHKTKNYTIMSNYHLKDKKIPFKAKGLLSYMLSLPENWDYSLKGLVANSKEGIKAIRNILQELEDNKYLLRVRKQDKSGKFYYEYSIYEIPFDNEPYYPKGYAVKGYTDNGTLINTNNKILNKKKNIKKKETNFEQRKYSEEEFEKLYNNK